MLKNSRFHQLSTSHHLTSSTPLLDDLTQVKFIGTLLSGTILAWFAPLLEHQSLIVNNFETFLKEFGASFGNLNKKRIVTSKLRALRQLSRLVFMYNFEFKQLTCDISWDEATLMS